MIRFVRFHVDGMNIAIRPEHVTTITCDAETPDVCHVLTVESDQPVSVHALFDDVVAALESATATPVAAVEVAPTDLERAAKILDLIADAAGVWPGGVSGSAIDEALGANGMEWTDTMEKARALAAKLRGGG